MSKLNRDVFYMIFEELQYDKKSLYSCLLANKIFCEIIIPILWKNPWDQLKPENEKLLLNVIFSHLSNESKNEFKNQGINFFTTLDQKPLFDYISFCKHLNLNVIFKIIDNAYNIFKKHLTMIKKELITLFTNRNIKFTHIYIPQAYNCQLHLLPGNQHLFSGLEFLNCSTAINKNDLLWLKEVCQSIKELDLIIEKSKSNPTEIAKLIEGQKKVIKVSFRVINKKNSELYFEILENSLVKHANTIQHFRTTKPPVTKILSSFVNLKSLELDNYFNEKVLNCLEDLSLPLLENLKASRVPIKALTELINNTNGYLTEVKIDYVAHNKFDNKKLIQAIYQNCPNLKYLKLKFRRGDIFELENLLIRCQHLKGLVIIIDNEDFLSNWDNLFKVLMNSSPIGLFKFKFWLNVSYTIDLESLKFFFDNWKERPPILLQIISVITSVSLDGLIKKYIAEGIVAKYDNSYVDNLSGSSLDHFEWI
ncbi:unnamed protein product [Rhizophagus irregularis]|uniref:F-box domain-containing protein n=1 Tax=Rhizophagus irregularis TaxID=588596 RepID=A0A2I1H9K1_9GLOM|nr:hypothetical protein RhiirA4_548794 [Rhizophagus irregularis]CAB4412253.1 unnamed protein product [Rhizophagus irregularis]